jgi:hypothetical protein
VSKALRAIKHLDGAHAPTVGYDCGVLLLNLQTTHLLRCYIFLPGHKSDTPSTGFHGHRKHPLADFAHVAPADNAVLTRMLLLSENRPDICCKILATTVAILCKFPAFMSMQATK